MSSKWQAMALILCLITTLLNVAVLSGQISTPVSARSAGTSKMLEDDDFLAGLSKIIRKTVRDYCTVGKRQSLDC